MHIFRKYKGIKNNQMNDNKNNNSILLSEKVLILDDSCCSSERVVRGLINIEGFSKYNYTGFNQFIQMHGIPLSIKLRKFSVSTVSEAEELINDQRFSNISAIVFCVSYNKTINLPGCIKKYNDALRKLSKNVILYITEESRDGNYLEMRRKDSDINNFNISVGDKHSNITKKDYINKLNFRYILIEDEGFSYYQLANLIKKVLLSKLKSKVIKSDSSNSSLSSNKTGLILRFYYWVKKLLCCC